MYYFYSFLKERTFKCHLCSRCFKRNWNLTQHQKIHNEIRKKTSCPSSGCTKTFYAEKNLKQHLQKSHNERLNSEHTLEWTDETPSTSLRYKCDYCGKSHPKKYNLEIHMKAYHMPRSNAFKSDKEKIKSTSSKPRGSKIKLSRKHIVAQAKNNDKKPLNKDKFNNLHSNPVHETPDSPCVQLQLQRFNSASSSSSSLNQPYTRQQSPAESSQFLLSGPELKKNSDANESFPCMADALSREDNEKFGVHIVAKRDIVEGEVLLATSAFATVEFVSCTGSHCFHCGDANNYKQIECKHCIDVWFCSKKCSMNKTHKKTCNRIHAKKDCKVTRLVTEIMNVASKKFDSIELFLQFCSEVMMLKKNTNKCLPPYSEYGELLTLKGYPEESHTLIAKRVVKLLKLLPQFSSLVNKDHQLFLIAYRHARCTPLNMFSGEQEIAKGGKMHKIEIYDILSRFNHSCEPNIDHYLDDDGVTYCSATRAIKQDEQCFINYFADSQNTNAEERQRLLEETWFFKCECKKCTLLN